MTELDDNLSEPARQLLGNYVRPTLAPARRAALQQRVMSAAASGAVPKLEATSTSVGSKTVMLKVIVGGAAACVGLAYVLLAGSGDEPRSTPVPAVAMQDPEPATPAPAEVPPAPVAPRTRPAPPAQDQVEPPANEPAETVRRTPRRKPERASPESTAAAEARLLAEAQLALRSGKHREALETADEHARRFPRGALVEAREAARAVARCHLRPSERARIRTAFEARFESSAFSRRVANACADGDGGT